MIRYGQSTVLKTSQGQPYYKSRFYPEIPLDETDIYIITSSGDRLDNIAYSYYNDTTLWWIISMANNNITNGMLFPQEGTQLRIPINLSNILDLYNKFNQAR